MTHQNIINKIIKLSGLNKMSHIDIEKLSPDMAYNVFLDYDISRKDGFLFLKLVKQIISDFSLAYCLIISGIINKSDGSLYELTLKNALQSPEQAKMLIQKHIITPGDVELRKD